MRSRLGAFTALLFAASLTVSGPAQAGTATISIDSVGSHKVKDGQVTAALVGKTLVQGTAIPAGAAPAEPPVARPLVADAGDSGYIATGTAATAGTFTLLGSGFGGEAPYTFAWSVEAGTLTGANAATAQVKAVGVTPGAYTATLTITDRTGATATDTVKYLVYATGTPYTLVDKTITDSSAGTQLGGQGGPTFTFDVPGTTVYSMRVRMTFGVQNDYDMRILDPNGAEKGTSGNGITNQRFGFEEFVVNDPVGGTWTVVADKYLTFTDNVRVVVTATPRPADPRPLVTSGGPYRLAIGAVQQFAGSVGGGTAPVTAGWDTDQNGLLDKSGTSFTGSFAPGRRLLTLKATDANGFERRETTSLFIADPTRLAAETTPLTVVAINDSGVNPYHLEFSAGTYPDPEVLALTGNFTKHPSEYIAGYPKDAQAIPITLGKGYFPAEDARGPDANGDGIPDGSIWDLKTATAPWGLEFGKLYWIPGTKIIGATQPALLSCSNCAAGNHVILDDDGHGTGSSSVSVGNRYGYCPTCLLFSEKGLNAGPASGYSWIDINSNSWGTVGNAPHLGLLGNPSTATRIAVERGQTVLFAAGNGTANAFETTSPTYGTPTTGPDWHVIVGAIRRDVQRPIIGDGTPAHLSSWGDGNLPSACRTGIVSQCPFSGTSAATPYTAGVFGNVLTEVRRGIGETSLGQRPGQVIADGFPVAGSKYLADGKLTRAELREVVLKTAFPLNQANTQNIPIFPYPWTAPYNGDINVLFEGYGAATPHSARRAIDVLMGKAALPVREAEDRWFSIDAQIRDSIWGGHDRDGDGDRDVAHGAENLGVTVDHVQTIEGMLAVIASVSYATANSAPATATSADAAGEPKTYWLHRSSEGEPQLADSCSNGVHYMDQTDSTGDMEPCFANRATTVLAAYRPIGIWPTASDIDFALPAGSTVSVELWVASDQVTVARPVGMLMAGDRELGSGAGTPTPMIGSGPWIAQGFPVNPNIIVGAPQIPTGVAVDQNKCRDLGELCWNKMTWSFTTNRHAVVGDQLTFQVSIAGIRALAFGHEGQHRSRITITPAAAPSSELETTVTIGEPTDGAALPEDPFTVSGLTSYPNFGTTEAGDHPTRKYVHVSVDDPTFANPVEANLTVSADQRSGSWTAPLPRLSVGAHTLYVRSCIDRDCATAERNVTVQDTRSTPRVQWQVVASGATPTADGWRTANGLLFYSFDFDTRTY
ncbi:MAG TPA: S8 family serine peptidase, partial [Frankiaceae bacterium]|nr:S8 family serine peptidase [Frankiaceae bacterium]